MRGASLRAKAALVGGPTWGSMSALAIAWAHVAWSAAARPGVAFFTIRELCHVRRQVAQEGRAWAQSNGPISRTHISLERIGWKATAPLE